MSQPQLWQQCLPLTHHSLQAFLLSVIERPQVYNLHQFLKHPQINTVDKKVLDLFNVFVGGTYTSISPQLKKELSPSKLHKMKKLTILTLFEGLKQIPMRAICSNLQSSEQQAMDLLIQMSISGDIQIKINQKTSTVEIHYSEIRGRPFSHQDTQMLEGKISTILHKNKTILDIIDHTYSEIKGKHEGRSGEGFKSPKILLGGHKRF